MWRVGSLLMLSILSTTQADAALVSTFYSFSIFNSGSQTVQIDQFNPALGTLTGVTIELSGQPPINVSTTGSVRFANNTSSSVISNISVSRNFAFSGPGVTVNRVLSVSQSGVTFPAFSQLELTLNSSVSSSPLIIPSNFLGSYIGTGKTNLLATSSPLMHSSASQITGTVTNVGSLNGLIRVTYQYNEVVTSTPEPGSMSLMRAAATGLVIRKFRRRRRPLIS